MIWCRNKKNHIRVSVRIKIKRVGSWFTWKNYSRGGIAIGKNLLQLHWLFGKAGNHNASFLTRNVVLKPSSWWVVVTIKKIEAAFWVILSMRFTTDFPYTVPNHERGCAQPDLKRGLRIFFIVLVLRDRPLYFRWILFFK